MLATYRSGHGFPGQDEYEPIGADNSLIPTNLPDACLVSDPTTALGVVPKGVNDDDAIPDWNAAQGSCDRTLNWQPGSPEHKRLSGVVSHAGYLVLRLRSYPAWKVAVNGVPISNLPRRNDGLIAVPVPQGSANLTADWSTTPDVIAGRWLSALALLLLIGLWLFERMPGRANAGSAPLPE
jgi:hypothetical protein